MAALISAVILAAGESRRMGEPKPLIHFNRKPFLETIIENFRLTEVSEIVVVLGHQAGQIEQQLDLSGVRVVHNKNYRQGQFTSFQTGVRSLPSDVAGAFLALVDQPQIGPKVIERVMQAFQNRPDRIAIPATGGRRGHPPLFPKVFFERIVTAPIQTTASEIIRENENSVNEVEVDDDCILWNINTRQDLRMVRQRMKLQR